MDRIVMCPHGGFQSTDGTPFFPLGGHYANIIPAGTFPLPDADRNLVYAGQETEPVVDTFRASEETWRRWFAHCRDAGFTVLRIFPRAGGYTGDEMEDSLDIGGRVNPRLWKRMDRYMQVAAEYGIRFQFLILIEPRSTVYYDNGKTRQKFALPQWTAEELQRAEPFQRKFLSPDGPYLPFDGYFTDPDVRACQRKYLREMLHLLRGDPRIFALELYNEMGWTEAMHWELEEAMIAWSNEMIGIIRETMPDVPVTISHPGLGMLGYDPVHWCRSTAIDFFSPHFYAGLLGESEQVDFPAAVSTLARYTAAVKPNFPGEWGVGGDGVTPGDTRLALRDSLWLSVCSGATGFFHWPGGPFYGEEYVKAGRILAAADLMRFPRRRADVCVDVSGAVGLLARKREYVGSGFWDLVNFIKDDHPAARAIRDLYAAQVFSLATGVELDFAADTAGYSVVLPLGEVVRQDPATLPRRFIPAPGWQVAWRAAVDFNPTLLYVRNYAPAAVGVHKRRLRCPASRPAYLDISLPAATYLVDIYDLDAGTVRTVRVFGSSRLVLADATSHDFVLVLRPVDPAAR
jgi:hypothetical protein